MNERVSLRLYPDSRPHNLTIRDLHKGLILLYKDKELVEEGAGFGVPIVKYKDRTLFSGEAETCILEKDGNFSLSKIFTMDLVSRKTFINNFLINDSIYLPLSKASTKAFMKHKNLRHPLYQAMKIREILNLQTRFVRVKPRGTIAVAYSSFRNLIKIRVDLKNLESDKCREIIILNEQGSGFFRECSDSSGLILNDEQIGAWEKIKVSEASFSCAEANLRFTLKNSDGASLYRGWEQVKEHLSWAGLNYSLNPETTSFSYEISLGDADSLKSAKD